MNILKRVVTLGLMLVIGATISAVIILGTPAFRDDGTEPIRISEPVPITTPTVTPTAIPWWLLPE
jgi:hypothetical protein